MSTQEMRGARSRVPGNRSDDWRSQALGLAGEGACRLDLQGRFVAVDGVLLAATGYDAEELLGEHVSTVLDDGSARRTTRNLDALGRGDADGAVTRPVTVRTADGEQFRREFRLARRLDGDGRVDGTVGVFVAPADQQRQDRPGRDGRAVAPGGTSAGATDAADRERDLERYETIVETVEDGIYTVDSSGRFTTVNRAYADLVGHDRAELLGEHVSFVVDEAVVDEVSAREAAMAAGDDVRTTVEATVTTPDGETIEAEANFGLVPTGDGYERVGVVRDISERKRRERELAAGRERLATLNEFNGVVQEISHAIVDADSRDAIERLICEQLAATDQFTFAWFGDVAPDGERVRPRTAAGAGEYLDGIHVPLGEDAPVGPIVRAIRTGETQTADDVLSDEESAPWRGHARRHGYRSFAAIPVTYEGIFYGVLNVYGEQPGVFDEETRGIVSRLGSVVGHAINALDRKKALVGDDVTEVEFRISDVFDVRGVDCGGGRVTFESILPTGDGTYVAYGSASDAGVRTLRTLQETVDHFTDLTVREQRRGNRRFVLRMREPPVSGLTAAVGGRVAEVRIEDDTMRSTVQLPYDADVREFVERVREAYPGAEVLAQRRRTRAHARIEAFETVLDDRLTDRQRVALEAAYVAGFFEWPRESTGEDVAESLGVSPATFHEHLRAAERHVLTTLFGAPTG